MARLAQDSKGNFKARKRLPDDVREDYGRLYGARHEAKFFAPASTKPSVARQRYGEWLAEIEGRFATIRAHHKGEGISLTHRQARALAGEWYDWFLARHPLSEKENWEQLRDKVHDAMREAIGDEEWEKGNPDDLWRDDEKLRELMRPVLADAGETSQFLAMKAMTLDNKARDQFLDFLYDDLSEALKRLMRMSDGDYGPDKYRERFPRLEGADKGDTPQQLFERWVSERKPAANSVESWQYVFRAMSGHFKGRSAASINPDDAQHWIKSLVTQDRSARTVRNTYITAAKTVFGWAKEHKYIPRNPFKKAKVTIPKSVSLRETKAFFPEECRTILKAALEIVDTGKPLDAAKRWVPWLLAYTGARPSEITQLRKSDVIERDGIHALLLTPEAGSIKSGKARTVPLHGHLIAQGFLKFVEDHRDGPLFYRLGEQAKNSDPVKVKKSRAAQVRQRLAEWVGSLGVKGPGLSPNHGWRHTFKQIADSADISERMSDNITGHAPKSVGAGYGEPTLKDKAKAMEKFPQYEV